MTRTTDLQSDLRADLLSDLASPAPLPSAPAPSSMPGTIADDAVLPAFTLTFTPTRWSRPSARAGRYGSGLSVRVGPWRFEVLV